MKTAIEKLFKNADYSVKLLMISRNDSSFSESYPQYMKYFTLEPRLPVNFDARTTAKFAVIMEAIGYLILDFNNKPKQLDRFIGYLAMVHKDMRLNEQDMHVC